jgi:uncharacterized protein with FMN-binding domain
LLLSTAITFGVETANDQFNTVLSDRPAPRLAPVTWKIIGAGRNQSQKRLSGKLSIQVQSGDIKAVAVLESTRFKAADDEIAAWIRARWQFRPNITHTFTLPVTVVVPATQENKPAPKLSEADLARLKNGEQRELFLSIAVDHGQITNISILHSTGDAKLDASAARWIKDNWVFNPDQSGLFKYARSFSQGQRSKRTIETRLTPHRAILIAYKRSLNSSNSCNSLNSLLLAFCRGY